ncbi:MAG TPA: hypothetical protein VMJ75_02135 [Candidatus Acidoferrales bacterium]|nr:hypothetical protein [Candidatus Acidoferrales bacterium]
MFFKSAAVLSLAAAAFGAETIPTPTGVVAHEWGTFTSVAGLDGNPVRWFALGGPARLPCFVHQPGVIYKSTAYSTVRMETPVIYFYASRKTTVSVSVAFPAGRITDWYPQANGAPSGGIDWKAVEVLPGEDLAFPSGQAGNHYYAARATDAAPLRVGKEQEKLLFYRGVGDIDVPIRPKFAADGTIEIRNASAHSVPAAIVFENRAGRIGFRTIHDLQASARLAPSELRADLAALREDLAGELVRAGLYPREAHAMIETWRDSWFEEGMRVIYIVPRAIVDAVLPLAVTPAPAETARVFVGRVEVLSPAMAEDIRIAAAANDRDALAKYGRFLPAFWEELHRRDGLMPASAPANAVPYDADACAK